MDELREADAVLDIANLLSLPQRCGTAAFGAAERRAAFERVGAASVCTLLCSGCSKADATTTALASSIVAMFCADAALASKLRGALGDLLGVVSSSSTLSAPPLPAAVFVDALDAAVAIASSSPAALCGAARDENLANCLCCALPRVAAELRRAAAAEGSGDSSPPASPAPAAAAAAADTPAVVAAAAAQLHRACVGALALTSRALRIGGAPPLSARALRALVSAATDVCGDPTLRWASIEALHAWALAYAAQPSAAVAAAGGVSVAELRGEGGLGLAVREWIGCVLRVKGVAAKHVDACSEIGVILLECAPLAHLTDMRDYHEKSATKEEATKRGAPSSSSLESPCDMMMGVAERFALLLTNAACIELKVLLDRAEQHYESGLKEEETVVSPAERVGGEAVGNAADAAEAVVWRLSHVAPTYFRAIELVLLFLLGGGCLYLLLFCCCCVCV